MARGSPPQSPSFVTQAEECLIFMVFLVWCILLFHCFMMCLLRDIFHTPMPDLAVNESLFVLKMPLNTNHLTN